MSSTNPTRQRIWTFLHSGGTILQGLRFVGSGLILFPLGLVVSAFCHEILGWPVQQAGFAAIAVLFCANYLAARAFVFRSRGGAKGEFARFVGIAMIMRAFEYVLFLALLRFAHLPYIYAMVAALAMSSASKFFIYRRWVFTGP